LAIIARPVRIRSLTMSPGGWLRPRGPRRYPRASAIARKFGFALVTLLALSLITFAATNLKSPTDVARAALGREVSPAAAKLYVREHGLDRPITTRYGDWLYHFARGDWGTSYVTNRSVRADVVPRLKHTLLLALAALVVSIPLSIGLGAYTARRSGSTSDLVIAIFTIVVASLPEFIVGLLLVMFLGIKAGLLPVDSTALNFGSFPSKVEAFVLPTLTLALAVIPHVARITRASARESFEAPFVRAAVLRGLSRRRVTWNYALRSVAGPVINAIAVNLVYLLSGVIVVENVFGFPGAGQLLVQAIGNGDVLAVQAIALVLGGVFVGTSFLADLIVVYLDPRLRPAV
jgi:peptide/nickel transport system permease protein